MAPVLHPMILSQIASRGWGGIRSGAWHSSQLSSGKWHPTLCYHLGSKDNTAEILFSEVILLCSEFQPGGCVSSVGEDVSSRTCGRVGEEVLWEVRTCPVTTGEGVSLQCDRRRQCACVMG
jgi:hypothetical protein